MTIHYILRENKLTPDPNDQSAVVIATAIADEDALVARMLASGSTFTEPDLRGMIQLQRTTIIAMLLEGMKLNTSLGNYSTRIRRVFTDPTDSFDPSRHEVGVSVSPSSEIRNAVRTQATVQKDVAAPPMPIIMAFRDVTSGLLNTSAKSGGIGELSGDQLKFNPAAADEGIFFVKLTDNTAVKAAFVSHNAAKLLVFQVPTLAGTEYRIEVRARFSPTGPVRTGDLIASILGVTLDVVTI